MTKLTQWILQKQILRSQFLSLSFITFALVAWHAIPVRAQQPWSTADTSGNINNLNTGNVGIGTASPSSILTVQTTGTDSGGDKYLRVKNTNSFTGLLLDPNQSGDAKWLILGGYPNAGDFTIREYGVANYLTIKKTSGNVGIGTTGPASKLEVATLGTESGIRISGTGGVRLDMYSTNANAGARNWTTRIDNIVFGDYAIWQSTTQGGDGYNNNTGNPRFYIKNDGNVGIGITTPSTKLHVAGSITVDGNINAKFQDVAEWVPASAQIPAGTVVVLDSTKSNHVMSSTKGYDTRVAGVISAQPGVALGERGDNKVLVATTGRVRIKVDASRGPIQVGDLLVTSNKPGMAMKSQPLSLSGVKIHRPGTLIGKALEPLAKGEGVILVLLSLQ